jgi:hypothetical protein
MDRWRRYDMSAHTISHILVNIDRMISSDFTQLLRTAGTAFDFFFLGGPTVLAFRAGRWWWGKTRLGEVTQHPHFRALPLQTQKTPRDTYICSDSIPDERAQGVTADHSCHIPLSTKGMNRWRSNGLGQVYLCHGWSNKKSVLMYLHVCTSYVTHSKVAFFRTKKMSTE